MLCQGFLIWLLIWVLIWLLIWLLWKLVIAAAGGWYVQQWCTLALEQQAPSGCPGRQGQGGHGLGGA
jgi:hypothetical protein